MNLHDQDTFLRGKNEGIQQGISQGAHQAKVETARNFLGMGLSVEQVSRGTGLSQEAIIELVNINLK